MRFEQFTQMPNVWVRDERLSWQARGILTHLMSHDVGYSITVQSLIDAAPNGREAVQSAVRELETFEYLTREQRRDSSGRLSHVDWMLHDPHDAQNTWSEPLDGIPADGKPSNGKPVAGNPASIRTPVKEHLNKALEVTTEAKCRLNGHKRRDAEGRCTGCGAELMTTGAH